MKKPIQPWDFVPVNEDTRYNFPNGMGVAVGKAKKNNQGKVTKSSVVRPAKDEQMKGIKKAMAP